MVFMPPRKKREISSKFYRKVVPFIYVCTLQILRMKKLLPFSFLLLLNHLVTAQSFQIYSEDTVMVSEDPYQLLESHAEVTNSTGAAIRTLVRREPVSPAPNHVNYFCWGISCYAPTTVESPDTLTVEAGGTNTTFKGYLDPSGFEGTSVFRYCFINAANPTDQSCYMVKYVSGVTSVAAAEPGKTGGIQASYEPSSQTIRVAINGGKIDTWNMLGQKVDLDWRYDGTVMIADASSLKPGYYFIFGNTEGKLWSARVIVTK